MNRFTCLKSQPRLPFLRRRWEDRSLPGCLTPSPGPPPLVVPPEDLPVVPALGPDVLLHASEDDATVIKHVLLPLLL